MALKPIVVSSGGGKTQRKHDKSFLICNTPQEFCRGNRKNEVGMKIHPTQEEAHNCTKKYLRKAGFIRLSSREWQTPQGSILVLSKKALRAYPGKYDGLAKGFIPRLQAPKVDYSVVPAV